MKTASNTNRTEMVKALKELEAKAETGWMRGDAGNIYCEKCPHNYPLMMPYGINGCAAEISLAVELRNAAPWLLKIAESFEPGDARCLKNVLALVRAVTGPETESDELACLRRLQAAAEEIER